MTSDRLALALALGALIAMPALAQEICDQPISPEDLAPPVNDPEFRAFLNGTYALYPRAAEEYVNYLGREHQGIFEDMRQVLERWTRYCAEHAGMRAQPCTLDRPAPVRAIGLVTSDAILLLGTKVEDCSGRLVELRVTEIIECLLSYVEGLIEHHTLRDAQAPSGKIGETLGTLHRVRDELIIAIRTRKFLGSC